MTAPEAPNTEGLRVLEDETRAKCRVDLNSDGTFSNVLKGCFIKCFEYAALCENSPLEKRAFFLAPALRGVCEDFIALRFLQQKAAHVRDELLLNKARSLIFDAAEKQGNFFKRYRPFQPVFTGQPEDPIPAASLPPTRNMAKDVGLNDLYDFMYAITSDVVHFNPRVIIRNAWGKNKKEFEYSVGNFDSYYIDFCRTYGFYFLCEFSKAFVVELHLSEAYMKRIAKLEEQLDEKLRWPEAITFEEMNMESPADALRIFMKMARKGSQGKRA